MAYNLNRHKVDKAMKSLTAVLASAPCSPVAIPDPANHECLVRTDTSDFGIGATPRQAQPINSESSNRKDQDGSYEAGVLADFSGKLHGVETRYSTYDKDLLTIRDALKRWRYYILGRHKVTTDHVSLLSRPLSLPRSRSLTRRRQGRA